MDPTNDLSFLRLKSGTHEVLVQGSKILIILIFIIQVLVAPENNFIILVLQQHVVEQSKWTLIFLVSSGNINSKNWHLCCIFSVDEILHIFSILYYQRCVSKSFLLDRSVFPLKMNELGNLLIEETLKIYGSNLFIFGKTFLFRLKSFENVFLKSLDIPQ